MHAGVAHGEDRQPDQAPGHGLRVRAGAFADGLEGLAQDGERLILPIAQEMLRLPAVEHRVDRDLDRRRADAHLGGDLGLDLLPTTSAR